MNQYLEDYLKEVADAAVTAASQTATTYTGTSSEISDPTEDAVLCICDEMEGVVKNIRLAKCRYVVRTSALTGSRSGHAALADTITAIFDSPMPAASVFSIEELNIGGSHVSENATGQGENSTWMTAISFTLGVTLNPTSSGVSYGGAILTYG